MQTNDTDKNGDKKWLTNLFNVNTSWKIYMRNYSGLQISLFSYILNLHES